MPEFGSLRRRKSVLVSEIHGRNNNPILQFDDAVGKNNHDRDYGW